MGAHVRCATEVARTCPIVASFVDRSCNYVLSCPDYNSEAGSRRAEVVRVLKPPLCGLSVYNGSRNPIATLDEHTGPTQARALPPFELCRLRLVCHTANQMTSVY